MAAATAATGFARPWLGAFMDSLCVSEIGTPLREAAIQGRLGPWTRALTDAVVATFPNLGWVGAAKGHASEFLPVERQEYLALDVIAFPAEPEHGWRFPVAVFELENSRGDDLVAYALWKVLCTRAGLRVVFCYRASFTGGVDLVGALTARLIAPLTINERTALGGETLLVVGSRDTGATFPYGFFKTWSLDANIGQFQPVRT
jgi:hypothetical protein